jgi:methylated-DNA-[protein]-cysteine S-methyltransferase
MKAGPAEIGQALGEPIETPFAALTTVFPAATRIAELTHNRIARIGVPGARAAGAATGRNPIGIIVPCHRIVGANGALMGYAARERRPTPVAAH